LLNGGGCEDTGKLSRHRANHPLAYLQGRQIDAFCLVRQRIQVSVIVPDFRLVELRNECNDSHF